MRLRAVPETKPQVAKNKIRQAKELDYPKDCNTQVKEHAPDNPSWPT
jgi:hypothetical protein